MNDQYDVKRVLQVIAETDRPATSPAADLARAQEAGRTRNRFRLGLAGLAVASVVGVGTVLVATDDPATPDVTASDPTAPGSVASGSGRGVRLVAATFDATPYTFDLTPQGWSVQGQNAFHVTIAPDDGSTSDLHDDFEGKLVIMFDANPPGGRAVDVDGRRFWITGDSGYTTISTRTTTGEPAGAVRIQYPDDAGWDEDTMLAFTASVHVGDGARHGLG
jgi:hypothetical protein